MRRGATVVEFLIVLSALAIGARLGVRQFSQWWLRGEATEIVEAVRMIDETARALHREGGEQRLAGAPVGEAPPALAERLPGDFDFRREAFSLGWSYWTLGDALGERVKGEGMGAVVVRIPDPALQNEFLRLAWPSLWYRSGDHFTFLVPGL